MNIFFLSFNPDECAQLYCDQHVNKILLEIVQMLYTTWNILGEPEWNRTAPRKKMSQQRGYKPVSNPNHPMVMWVRSSRENYLWTAKLGMALAIEFHHRYHKIHACTRHIMWLYSNVPTGFREITSEKAHYSTCGFPSLLTPIPQCMPKENHRENVIEANYLYYLNDKLPFAKWSRDGARNRFESICNTVIHGRCD